MDDRLKTIVDLEKYPIQDLDSPIIKNLIKKCKVELDQHSCSTIPNFILPNSLKVMNSELEKHLNEREAGVTSSVDGIISQEEIDDLLEKLNVLLDDWIKRISGVDTIADLVYRNRQNQSINEALFVNALDENYPEHWKVSNSLREVGASTVIKTVQQ